MCVQAVVQVCDNTGSVCVVLWNSVCVKWYCHLKPGDIISLSHYRVKRCFQAETEDIGKPTHMRSKLNHLTAPWWLTDVRKLFQISLWMNYCVVDIKKCRTLLY